MDKIDLLTFAAPVGILAVIFCAGTLSKIGGHALGLAAGLISASATSIAAGIMFPDWSLVAPMELGLFILVFLYMYRRITQ